jgi:hypothetical protein
MSRPARGPLPNAFIGGAQKSGTTSLHHGLESHPQIFFPRRPQEIHFFDIDKNYRRGVDHYRSYFRDHGGEPVVAQTSPLYLYEPAVAGRIAEVSPQARFLFILRHPVDRAYSHYWHEVRYGYERLPFAAALAAEPERLRGGFTARRHFSYLDRGRYAGQIERFLQRFTPEQVLPVLYDDLAQDQPALLRRCAAFLGADPEHPDWVMAGRQAAGAPAHRYNRARLPRLWWLQRMTRDLRNVSKGAVALVDAVNLRPVAYPPMDEELRRRLSEQMAPEIERLQVLTGLPVVERWQLRANQG